MDDETRLLFFKNYQDRGIVKWQGFFLSEHTSALGQVKYNEYHVVKPKTLMTNIEINQVINQAVVKNLPVAIQLNELDSEGQHSEDITGKIRGYNEAGIYIGDQIVEHHLIRNIELTSVKKWSEISSK